MTISKLGKSVTFKHGSVDQAIKDKSKVLKHSHSDISPRSSQSDLDSTFPKSNESVPPRQSASLPRTIAPLTPTALDIPESAHGSVVHRPEDARAAIGPAGTFTGKVTLKDGQMVSNHPVIHALLHYANPKDIALPKNASLTLTLDPGAAEAYEKLQELCGVEEVELRAPLPHNENTPLLAVNHRESVDGNAVIPLLHEVIKHGRAALGTNAHIDTGDRSVHVYDHLAALAPSVSSEESPALATHINQTIAANTDVKAKLGAESMLQIATKKEYAPVGLLGSLLVSSGLGSAWELLAAPAVKAAMFGTNFSPIKLATKLAGIDSVPPVVIETLDTMCVLAILKAMKGEKDWTLKDLVPNALKAGVISSAFSYPNNLMQYVGTGSKIGDLLANVLTTEAAIFSAGAGVPMEVKESELNMKAAILQKIRDGVLAPPPEGVDPQLHVARLATQAQAVEPSSSVGQKSMTFAAMVGTIPLILSDKVTGVMSESALRIVRSAVFNPIEAIALNALVFTGNLRLPGVFTSDNEKHANVVKLVLDNKGGSISDQKLSDIVSPQREMLRTVGSGIINGLSGMFNGVNWLAVKSGLKQDDNLEARLPYEAARNHGAAGQV